MVVATKPPDYSPSDASPTSRQYSGVILSSRSNRLIKEGPSLTLAQIRVTSELSRPNYDSKDRPWIHISEANRWIHDEQTGAIIDRKSASFFPPDDFVADTPDLQERYHLELSFCPPRLEPYKLELNFESIRAWSKKSRGSSFAGYRPYDLRVDFLPIYKDDFRPGHCGIFAATGRGAAKRDLLFPLETLRFNCEKTQELFSKTLSVRDFGLIYQPGFDWTDKLLALRIVVQMICFPRRKLSSRDRSVDHAKIVQVKLDISPTSISNATKTLLRNGTKTQLSEGNVHLSLSDKGNIKIEYDMANGASR